MIIIANRGACPRRAIELIGHTTKDGETTVGRFGSGTAYAVALALRQGLDVTISSHDEDGPYEVQPYLKEVTVGDAKARQVVWRYRRGSSLFRSWWDTAAKALSRAWSVPTSFSVELGHKDWHGAFPVVREFISNARDADPDGFQVWIEYGTVPLVDPYLEKAKSSGYTAVTVIKIENPTCNVDAPERYIENWSDNFRWEPHHNGDNCGEAWRSGLAAIYRKPEPSPLKLFVRGVRCPWPGPAPVSMYDYSLNLDLTEARTIKSEGSASTAMSMLWVRAPRELLGEMLRRLPEHKGCWESESCNEYAYSYEPEKPMAVAWRDVHGDAPVAGPSDPPVPGAVLVAQSMRNMLARNGVPTAQSRTVVVEVFERGTSRKLEPEIVVPRVAEQMAIALEMAEAHRLLWLLEQYEPRKGDPITFDDLRQRLRDAGARPMEYKSEESEPTELDPPTDPGVWHDPDDVVF